MAIESLSDLKAGHLYKYENENTVSIFNNNYINFYSSGYVKTNGIHSSGDDANGHIGMKSGDTGTKACLNTEYGWFGSFTGIVYFVFKDYVGTPTALLPYITEVDDYYVFDRNDNDVSQAKEYLAVSNYDLVWLKGCLNAFDLARVESNLNAVVDLLLDYGYQLPTITTKLDWLLTDVLDSANINRIISNVEAIGNTFIKPSGWLTPSSLKTYQDINKIERNIALMYNAIVELLNASPRAGTFSAYTRNNEYNILPLKSN